MRLSVLANGELYGSIFLATLRVTGYYPPKQYTV